MFYYDENSSSRPLFCKQAEHQTPVKLFHTTDVKLRAKLQRQNKRSLFVVNRDEDVRPNVLWWPCGHKLAAALRPLTTGLSEEHWKWQLNLWPLRSEVIVKSNTDQLTNTQMELRKSVSELLLLLLLLSVYKDMSCKDTTEETGSTDSVLINSHHPSKKRKSNSSMLLC